MTYWRARVERPDGDGGWTRVATFGTPETPGKTSARYLHGDSALAAAQLLLSHVWPVNLTEHNQRYDPDRWRDARLAETGIADHRITVDVDETNLWSIRDDTGPLTLTITVAELRLTAIRTAVAQLVAEQAKLKELTEQIRIQRSEVRGQAYRKRTAQEEAVRAGVDPAAIAKASRAPRTTKPKRSTS